MAPPFITVNKRVHAACPPQSLQCLPIAPQKGLDMRLRMFRFMDLTPEIRMMIYEFVFSLSSIDNYLKKYHTIFELPGNRKMKRGPIIFLTYPSI